MIKAASALEPAGTIRPVMYATLIGLIASTGMRISEALALEVDDITTDGLLVRESKFRKSRLLPVHATARRALELAMPRSPVTWNTGCRPASTNRAASMRSQ